MDMNGVVCFILVHLEMRCGTQGATAAMIIDAAHHQKCEDLQVQEKGILRNFWILLIVVAVPSLKKEM